MIMIKTTQIKMVLILFMFLRLTEQAYPIGFIHPLMQIMGTLSLIQFRERS